MSDYFEHLTMELKLMYLKQRQSLPLSIKIELSKRRIIEWYEAHEGKVYVSFSGGKDSTALLHLVRSCFPEVPAVFVDTGLEYPEIREFVLATPNVVWLKPKKNFKRILEEDGYPVIGKNQASSIRKLQTQNLSEAYRNKLMYGDEKGNAGKVANKWHKLINSKFRVSEKCCDWMKKKPLEAYNKEVGRFAITGEMADESMLRQTQFIKYGCNAFGMKIPRSKPLSFWLESDIWDYIRTYNIPYSPIYNMGEKRTGCIFCAFGVQHDGEPNRFQRLKISHPQLHKYCMETLRMAEILDFMEVKY